MNPKIWRPGQCVTYLTNGTEAIEIECGRYGCGITPPPGVMYGFMNGEHYINGRVAWFEIRRKDDGWDD